MDVSVMPFVILEGDFRRRHRNTEMRIISVRPFDRRETFLCFDLFSNVVSSYFALCLPFSMSARPYTMNQSR